MILDKCMSVIIFVHTENKLNFVLDIYICAILENIRELAYTKFWNILN